MPPIYSHALRLCIYSGGRPAPQRLLPYSRGDIPVLVIGGHINFAPSNLVERHMHRRPFYLL